MVQQQRLCFGERPASAALTASSTKQSANPCGHGTIGIEIDLQLLQAFRQTAPGAH
jgi:hypothetical protein